MLQKLFGTSLVRLYPLHLGPYQLKNTNAACISETAI